jgi:hypothetical protein
MQKGEPSMFEVDLKTQVTPHGSMNPNWGGAACCQHAMTGYPPGATSCYIPQSTIWDYIQANNREPGIGPWGYGWYSDPFAITKTLNDLCPPEHHWVDVSGTDKYTVLYTLFKWMANYKYVSLVCVFAHDYWSTLVYYRTSDDPRFVNNPTLDLIGLYEPYYSVFGMPEVDYKEINGSVWMSNPYYWGTPCGGSTNPQCGQIWKDKYVGIGEPPEVGGKIRVKTIPRIGKKLISPKDATSLARTYLAERQQRGSKFLLERMTGVRNAQPMLVREFHPKPFKQRAKEDVRYYLVPFANRYEVDKTGSPLARLSILVNAYTGGFEELCVFPRPVRYLSESEVLAIAGRSLGLSRREAGRMEVELVFRPLRPHVSSALPAWKVEFDDRALFVTQFGLVLATLLYSMYRGA